MNSSLIKKFSAILLSLSLILSVCFCGMTVSSQEYTIPTPTGISVSMDRDLVYLADAEFDGIYYWEGYAKITYTYSDGTSYTECLWNAEYTHDDNQEEAPWGLGEHTVNITAYGFTDQLTVNIVEKNDITAISAVAKRTDPIYEGVDIYIQCDIDPETGEKRYYNGYSARLFEPELTIEYGESGETVPFDELPGQIEIIQSYENPIVASTEPQTIRAKYFGVEFEFEATVLPNENHVEAISLKLDPVIEGIGGEYGYPPMGNMMGTERMFYYDFSMFPYEYNPVFTVSYSDGRENEVYDLNHPDFDSFFQDVQFEGYAYGVGETTIGVSYCGKVATAVLKVEPNDVEEFKVNVGSTAREYVDADIAEPLWGEKYLNYGMDKFGLTFDIRKSGEAEATTYTLDELSNNQLFGNFFGQDNENSLKLGKNNLIVCYGGKPYNFEVELVDSGIKDVTVTAQKSLTENGNASFRKTKFAGINYGWNYYDLSMAGLEIKVDFSDDQTKSVEFKYNQNYEGTEVLQFVSMDFINPQSYDNQLTLGENTIKANYLGKEVEFKVKLEPNADDGIKEIKVVSCNDVVKESLNDGLNVSSVNPTFEIVYNDETVDPLTITANELMLGEMSTQVEIYQCIGDEPEIGEVLAVAKLYGRTCYFKVNVTQSPIESIRFFQTEPALAYQGGEYSAMQDMDSYKIYYMYRLDALNIAYEVTYSDESVKTYYSEAELYEAINPIIPNFYIYLDQSPYNQIGIGTNTYDISYLGNMPTQIELTVTEGDNPIESISAAAKGFLFLNNSEPDNPDNPYQYDFNNLLIELTLNYQNVSHETISPDFYNSGIFIDRYNSHIKLGTNELKLYYKGKDCTLTFEVYDSTSILTDSTGKFSYILNGENNAVIVNYNDPNAEEIIIPTTLDGHTVTDVFSLSQLYDSRFENLISLTVPDGVNANPTLKDTKIETVRNLTIGTSFNEETKNIIASRQWLLNLNNINLTAENAGYKTVDGMLLSKDGKTLYFIGLDNNNGAKVPKTVTTISEGAFKHSYNDVTIPSTVTSIDDNCGLVGLNSDNQVENTFVSFIYCDEGSAAAAFADKYNIIREPIPCEHVYGEAVRVPVEGYEDKPYCQQEYWMVKYCTICNEPDPSSYEWNAPIDHDNKVEIISEGDWRIGLASNIRHYCSMCDDYEWIDYSACLYGPFTWITEPEGDNQGEKTAYCRFCGTPYTCWDMELDNYGDINGDCEINTKDLISLKKNTANNNFYDKYSDLDGDGNVASADLAVFTKYIVDAIRNFPVYYSQN